MISEISNPSPDFSICKNKRSDSPKKSEDVIEVNSGDGKLSTVGIIQKAKKSFCIDALLARNENKNIFGADFNFTDVRCNNEISRCFRKTAELGNTPCENSEQKKTFLDAFEKHTQKGRLLQHFNINKFHDESEFGAVSVKISREIEQLENGKNKFEELESSESKISSYPHRLPENSPEYEIRREYENSRSESPFSGKTNETRSNSPGPSEISSPPISPGTENDFRGAINGSGDDFRGSHIFPRPGLLVTANGPQSFINQGQNLMLGSRPNIPQLGPHPAFMAYSSPHSFTSAFHPLSTDSSGSPNSKVSNGSSIKAGVNVSSNSGSSILSLNPGGSQHLHHMQLEWLARTGMFYPRLPDLTGKKNFVYIILLDYLSYI